MGVLTFEICWAVNGEIIKQVTSSWSIFIQLCRSCLTKYAEDKLCIKLVLLHTSVITVSPLFTTTLYRNAKRASHELVVCYTASEELCLTKQKYNNLNFSECRLSLTRLAWPTLRLNPSLQGDKPVNNLLNHDPDYLCVCLLQRASEWVT